MTASAFPDDLRRWLEDELAVTITSAGPIGAGASRATWAIDVSGKTGPYRLVVRVDTGTGPVAGTPLTLAREAVVYGALRGSGVPVPRLFAVAPDGRALVMAHVDGEPNLSLAADAERASVGRDYLTLLARLHQLDAAALELPGFTFPATGADHALADLGLWRSILEDRASDYAATPTLHAVDWLRDNAPERASGTALCHGDAGPGNFMFQNGAVTALLDWEFAHVGDPHDDLAWVSVRNHLLGRPLDLADVFSAWSKATGVAVDASLLAYYRVFVLARMAISCDATLAWKDGVEDESILTQVLLRPWLAGAIVDALRFTGEDDAGLGALQQEAEEALARSSHADLVRMIPALEPLTRP